MYLWTERKEEGGRKREEGREEGRDRGRSVMKAIFQVNISYLVATQTS